MVLELRPAHDPNETYGFVGVVTSLKDLSASVWMWHREGNNHDGTVAHPQGDRDSAEPAAADDLPPLLKGSARFHRSSPTSTSRSTIDSSTSRAGAGELKQFDVSDPFNPIETGSVKLGGIVRRQAHPRVRTTAQRRTADGRDQP